MIHGPRTLGRIFKARISKTPDRYAIGWIENNEVRNITFSDYKKNIEILATGFYKIGMNVGDKVSILAQTCKEWHFLDWRFFAHVDAWFRFIRTTLVMTSIIFSSIQIALS